MRERQAVKLAIVMALAAASSLTFAAGSAPVRLVGVSAQGNAVLIESTEPVAYVVKRPDPLTLLVELHNVTVANAANAVDRRDPIAAIALEQGAADGQAIGRVRLTLARPLEYTARSARNTIRVELNSPVARTASAPFPGPTPAPALDSPPVAAVAAAAVAVASQEQATTVQSATLLERVRSSRTSAATTVTLTGNGRLTPAEVRESEGAPRRLILDFPNVASKAPAETSVAGELVKKVRVALNSREPLVTRVVMEVADGATYHVERTGADGKDLAVIFEAPQATETMLVAPEPAPAGKTDREPDIPLDQAIANAAALTPKDTPAPPEPVAALKEAVSRPVVPAARKQSAPAPQQPTRPPATPAPPPSTTQVITSSGEKQYRGNPITLDFSGADLRSVLRYFNEISGLNIIIDPSVPATPIDIVLKDVPWDQAFETLLRTHKLGYTAEGTILRIAPLSVLAEE